MIVLYNFLLILVNNLLITRYISYSKIESFPNYMGQAKSQLKHPPQPNQELQLVDTAQNLYMNIRNNKLYIKNDVFVGNIEDVQY